MPDAAAASSVRLGLGGPQCRRFSARRSTRSRAIDEEANAYAAHPLRKEDPRGPRPSGGAVRPANGSVRWGYPKPTSLRCPSSMAPRNRRRRIYSVAHETAAHTGRSATARPLPPPTPDLRPPTRPLTYPQRPPHLRSPPRERGRGGPGPGRKRPPDRGHHARDLRRARGRQHLARARRRRTRVVRRAGGGARGPGVAARGRTGAGWPAVLDARPGGRVAGEARGGGRQRAVLDALAGRRRVGHRAAPAELARRARGGRMAARRRVAPSNASPTSPRPRPPARRCRAASRTGSWRSRRGWRPGARGHTSTVQTIDRETTSPPPGAACSPAWRKRAPT
jgi:hypothetical protein